MFASHFRKETKALQEALSKSLRKQGASAPEKPKNTKTYAAFYTFLRGHLSNEFTLSEGQVRNHRQVLKKNCDLIVYKQWCAQYLGMTGNYVLVEDIYAVMSLETSYRQQALGTHLSLTRALKSLYISQREEAARTIIPLYSIFFVYTSSVSLLAMKQQLTKYLDQKDIPLNQQIDLICVLDKGLIIKDWEKEGHYRGLQTEGDTLMWFYIILMEYLDRGGEKSLPLRDYVKSGRSYTEC